MHIRSLCFSKFITGCFPIDIFLDDVKVSSGWEVFLFASRPDRKRREIFPVLAHMLYFHLVIWTWTTSVERVNLQTRRSGKSKILALSKTGTGSVDSLLKCFMFNERRECVYPDREVQWLLQIPPTLFSLLYLLRLREIEALLTVIQISGLYSIDGNDGRGINGLSWLRGRSVDGTTKLRAAVRTISNQSASRFVHLNWVLLLSAMNAKWFEHFKIEHTFTYDKHMYLYVNWIFNKTSTDLAL